MRRRLAPGELEARVMDAVWSTDGWVTSAELHEQVSSRRRPLAYTTVMTIVVRLWKKGMLERRRSGRGYAYRARATREEWAAERMRELLDAAGDQRSALSHFVASIDAHEASALRRALEGRRRR